jgi:flagellar protein FliO/FliZ
MRNKLLLAAALLLGLCAAATARGIELAHLSRAMLGVLAAAGVAWAWYRAHHAPRLSAPPRLQVVSRSGLSARAGVALIEVDGRPYLIVYGEGHASVRPTAKRGRTAFSTALRSVS